MNKISASWLLKLVWSKITRELRKPSRNDWNSVVQVFPNAAVRNMKSLSNAEPHLSDFTIDLRNKGLIFSQLNYLIGSPWSFKSSIRWNPMDGRTWSFPFFLCLLLKESDLCKLGIFFLDSHCKISFCFNSRIEVYAHFSFLGFRDKPSNSGCWCLSSTLTEIGQLFDRPRIGSNSQRRDVLTSVCTASPRWNQRWDNCVLKFVEASLWRSFLCYLIFSFCSANFHVLSALPRFTRITSFL